MFESRKSGKRGAITGTRLKKASSQRILAQFGDQPVQAGYASVKSADRAPQRLEERRIVDNDAWVSPRWSNVILTCTILIWND